MSLDRPSGDPSPADAAANLALAETLRERGEPLLEALESHSRPAREHSLAAAAFAFAAAAELGLARERCEVVREATVLHEVGQVYATGAPLYGALQEESYRLARGAEIPSEVCEWLLRARENFDGSGAEGLAGEQIPIESRLIRTACAFQLAVSEPEGDQAGLAPTHAIDHLAMRAGSELDPRVAAALIAVVQRAAG